MSKKANKDEMWEKLQAPFLTTAEKISLISQYHLLQFSNNFKSTDLIKKVTKYMDSFK